MSQLRGFFKDNCSYFKFVLLHNDELTLCPIHYTDSEAALKWYNRIVIELSKCPDTEKAMYELNKIYNLVLFEEFDND